MTQKYDPSLGIQGNLEKALEENTKRKNDLIRFKQDTKFAFDDNDEALVDVAEVASDSTDASVELAELIADLTARVEALEGKND